MVGAYDYWLVLLSVVVAIAASFVALDLAARLSAPNQLRTRVYWLTGGALSMGTGIWSMHFIGMLAFRLPIPVSYDVTLTLASLLIAVTASWFALWVAGRETLSRRRLAAAGFLMGFAIVSMHYVGMYAMRMQPPIHYRPGLFGLSIVIAIAASLIALWFAFKQRAQTIVSAFWSRAGSAVVMGVAIVGMHYTGMAAARFEPNSICTVSSRILHPISLGAALGALSLLFLLATLLVSAYEEYRATLDARVDERTRIARELHDTLLQSFHGLLLRFQAVYEMLPASPAKQSLGHAIDQAAQAITEGRDAVQGLRASVVEINDLALAVRTFGEELAADQQSAALYVVVEGGPRTLHPIVRDEIYRIACEALRNAFKHAEATQIEVEIRYDERQLRLRVRDDGKGIDPQFLSEEGRAGHYGLHGMRERAKLMNGKLTVWSALDSGAEVELSIPAARAYAAFASKHRARFARKFHRESAQRES
jgi:NO-binding membrane sensor protein with MHYT domain